MTIERLSDLRSQDLKTVTDADDAIIMSDAERELLDQGNGRVLLFHLSGPMIFGVAKAISREQTAMEDHDVLILDLSDVPLLGVTASLAIENAIKDAVEQGRQVFIVGATGKVKKRLEKFGILRFLSPDNLLIDRKEALERAVAFVKQQSNIVDNAVFPGTDFPAWQQ